MYSIKRHGNLDEIHLHCMYVCMYMFSTVLVKAVYLSHVLDLRKLFMLKISCFLFSFFSSNCKRTYFIRIRNI